MLLSSSGAPDCPRTAAPSAFPSALVTIAAAPGRYICQFLRASGGDDPQPGSMNRSQKAALSGDSAFGHVKGPHDAVGFCANLRGGDGGAQFRLPRARLQGGLSSGQSRFARLTKGCQRRFLLIKHLVHGSQLLLQHTRIHADQQLTRTHRLPLAYIHLPHPARLQGDEGLFIRVGDNPLKQSGADQFPPLHHRGAHGCPWV